MCSNYPEIKFEPALEREKHKIELLSSYTHVVHTTAKQVISRRRKNENVCEMSKNENCTCKACKTIVFHRQMCKFMTFLLPSLSWLLKLPIREFKARFKHRTLHVPNLMQMRNEFSLICIRFSLCKVRRLKRA